MPTALQLFENSAIDSSTGLKAHILGYGYQSTSNIEKSCQKILQRRHEHSLKQIAILQNHGYDISPEVLIRSDNWIYNQHIMVHLVKNHQAQEMFGDFYKKIFKNAGIFNFDTTYMPIEEAVSVFAADGGIPVLAPHTLQQNNLYW